MLVVVAAADVIVRVLVLEVRRLQAVEVVRMTAVVLLLVETQILAVVAVLPPTQRWEMAAPAS